MSVSNPTMSVLNPKPHTTVAFTDGACKGNPGPGGWGAFLVLSDGTQVEYFGGEPHTTNNKMELMGAIIALEESPSTDLLEIWTDSSYVKNGITLWIDSWKKNGWKTAAKKPVKNQVLWQRLDALQSTRQVSWHWVKGHAGHAGNEKADDLANRGISDSSVNRAQRPDSAMVDPSINSRPIHSSSLKSSTIDSRTVNNSSTIKKN